MFLDTISFLDQQNLSKKIETLARHNLPAPTLWLLKKYAKKVEQKFYKALSKKYAPSTFWDFSESDLSSLKDATKYIYNLSLIALHNGNYDLALDICKIKYELINSIAQTLELDLLNTRFFTEWSYAIGHMALLWYYLILDNNHEVNPSHRIIAEESPCNPKLLSLFRPFVRDIITDPIVLKRMKPLTFLLEEPLHVIHTKNYGAVSHVFACCAASKMSPNSFPILRLPEKDEANCLSTLKLMGYDEARWICALHIRETENPNLRNAAPDSYQEAIDEVYKKGGICIRIGELRSKNALKKNVIDLSSLDKDTRKVLDIYVIANCKFYIGTNSGPSFLATAFQKPIFFTNWWPVIRPTHFEKNLVTPKQVIDIKTGRRLLFDNSMYSKIGLSEDINIQRRYGIKVVDNSQQDIKDGVVQLFDEVVIGAKRIQYDNPLKQIIDNSKYKMGVHDARIPLISLDKYS